MLSLFLNIYTVISENTTANMMLYTLAAVSIQYKPVLMDMLLEKTSTTGANTAIITDVSIWSTKVIPRYDTIVPKIGCPLILWPIAKHAPIIAILQIN